MLLAVRNFCLSPSTFIYHQLEMRPHLHPDCTYPGHWHSIGTCSASVNYFRSLNLGVWPRALDWDWDLDMFPPEPREILKKYRYKRCAPLKARTNALLS